MASALRSPLLRRTLPAFRSQPAFRTQRAPFQTTTIRPILSPLPQKLDGSVNDPVKVPEADPGHGSYHWTAER
jgi:succinate dehydrogenase (ubiquinone) membrane anchor subunit